MAYIRPSAELRNNYNEISKICHQTNQPVYITKNGYNDLVILSNEAYEKYEEQRIEILISEYFNKKFPNLESFRKDIYEKIEKSLKDIEDGKIRPLSEFCAEMEEKYSINESL